jgi:hypothetical protein
LYPLEGPARQLEVVHAYFEADSAEPTTA